MPRNPCKFTQADFGRALKAAQKVANPRTLAACRANTAGERPNRGHKGAEDAQEQGALLLDRR
jgi:hypothetical protein